ncbi:hypothetical protein [Zavarzinia sp.]|uniref:hypothetical protein n=1 Tax=Zavarzinia sp. TaxID=2027920 RepID=UPI0035631470
MSTDSLLTEILAELRALRAEVQALDAKLDRLRVERDSDSDDEILPPDDTDGM